MKLEYPKEWFARSAEIEGVTEVGGGLPPTRHDVEPQPNDTIGIDGGLVGMGEASLRSLCHGVDFGEENLRQEWRGTMNEGVTR